MSQLTSKSSPINYSLLTDNASPLEKSLEKTFSKLLNDINPPVPHLRFGMHTPTEVLPHLAAEKMVTYWHSTDSAEIKRRQIANAQKERRLSGTKQGLRTALDSIGYSCEITTKRDNSDLPPFAIDIVAWKVDSTPVNGEVINQLIHKLSDIKSERDSFELALTFGVSVSFELKAARAPSVSVSKVGVKAKLWEQPNYRAGICVVIASSRGVSITPISLTASLPTQSIKNNIYIGQSSDCSSVSVSPLFITSRL